MKFPSGYALPSLRSVDAQAVPESTAGTRVARPAPPSRVAFGAGAFAFGIGAVVLAGWMLGSEVLKAVVPGTVAMKVNTAIAFSLIGVGIAAASAAQPRSRVRRVGYVLVASAVCLAAVTGIQYVLGVDLGIDSALVREAPGAAGTVHPGRMSPFTVVAFVAIGGAVFLAARGRTAPVVALAAGTGLVAGVNVLDRLFAATVPTFLAGYSQMALNTAGTFLVLSVGVLALIARGGPLSVFSDAGPAGVLSRRLAIAALTIPITLAWLRLAGERAGFYDTAYGVVITTVGTIALFFVVTWFTARAVNHAEHERADALDAVRESQQRLQAILDNSPLVTFIKDAAGRYLFVNKAYEDLFQLERSAVLGTTDADHLPPAVVAALTANDRRVLAQSRPLEIEEEVQTSAGMRTFLSVKFPLYDVDGNAYAVCGVATDITERNDAARRLTELSTELARSNAELEAFASAASHDLQEPLRKIQAFGDRLAGRLAGIDDNDAASDLERIVGAARRMSGLIQDLLAYARVSTVPVEPVPVDLGRAVADVMVDLETRITDSGAVMEIGELPTVRGDLTQLRQVLQNLIGNALKFTIADRQPVIRIQSTRSSSSDGRAGWAISVTDNGAGFDPKYADRLFAPFQRLHGRSEYEGTGMGLAICRKIIERHGGTIVAESAAGVGTTFTAWLPAMELDDAGTTPAIPARDAGSGVTP